MDYCCCCWSSEWYPLRHVESSDRDCDGTFHPASTDRDCCDYYCNDDSTRYTSLRSVDVSDCCLVDFHFGVVTGNSHNSPRSSTYESCLVPVEVSSVTLVYSMSVDDVAVGGSETYSGGSYQ